MRMLSVSHNFRRPGTAAYIDAAMFYTIKPFTRFFFLKTAHAGQRDPGQIREEKREKKNYEWLPREVLFWLKVPRSSCATRRRLRQQSYCSTADSWTQPVLGAPAVLASFSTDGTVASWGPSVSP